MGMSWTEFFNVEEIILEGDSGRGQDSNSPFIRTLTWVTNPKDRQEGVLAKVIGDPEGTTDPLGRAQDFGFPVLAVFILSQTFKKKDLNFLMSP